MHEIASDADAVAETEDTERAAPDAAPSGERLRDAPAKRKIAVLIVGMHRSGTSALARMLSLLGCDLPRTLLPGGRGNEPGHWESVPILNLNNEILASAGSSWHDWERFNPAWCESPVKDGFRDRALETLEHEFGRSRLFVLKDPRNCRLLPFWIEVLEAFGATPHIICPVRHPLEVAASLQRRDGFDPSFGRLLWLRHMLDAEVHTRALKRAFLRYDAMLAGWRSLPDRLGRDLGLAWPRRSSAVDVEIDAFLSPVHRHHAEPDAAVLGDPSLSGWIRSSFGIFDRWARGDVQNSDRDELDRIRAAFDEAAPAFAQAVAAGQQAARLSAALEPELAIARGRAATVESALAAKKMELAQRDAALAAKKMELAQRDAALAEARIRNGALEQACAAKDAELARRDAVLAETLARNGALEQASVAKREVLAQRHAELAQTKARIDALEATVAAKDGELARRTIALAEIKARVGTLEATVAAKDGELARRAIALAEIKAQVGGLEEAVAAKEAEVGILQEAAAAREARIGALQTTVAELLHSTSWRLTAPLRTAVMALRRARAKLAQLSLAGRRQAAMTPSKPPRPAGLALRRARYSAVGFPLTLGVRALVTLSRAPLRDFRDARAIARSELFDRDWYLKSYPDVAARGIDPVRHYVAFGAREGRDPGPNFSTRGYLACYPDVNAAGVNPLAHYIRHGRAEGRFIGSPHDNSAPTDDRDFSIYYRPSHRPSLHAAPKVSVIVPNYNHQPYLKERLDSIFAQTYQNFEVILLDDGSQDASLEVLSEYAGRFPDRARLIVNERNSGKVFDQWKKGLDLATGELVWIAESDDCCSLDFLAEVTKHFADQAVMLAFCRTDFVAGQPPVRVWTSEDYWSAIGFNRWPAGFVKSAHWLVNNGWGVRNIIPNASSAVFRHPGNLDLFLPKEWTSLRLCGDWIFYLTIVRGGLVAYTPRAVNFYRQHPAGTSIKVQKTDAYYREYGTVAQTLLTLYKLEPAVLDRQQSDLHAHWTARRGKAGADEAFRSLYDPEKLRRSAEERKPNLVMVTYAFAAGGGETFPIQLANLLKEHGFGVTLLNANQEPAEAGVRAMLARNIPVLEFVPPDKVAAALVDLGAEIVHTHHANMDLSLSQLLRGCPDIKQVVSLHGMYEMMGTGDLARRLMILEERVSCFVYAAEKNLAAFPEWFRDRKRFVRIDNALPAKDITPVTRAALGIENDAFVLCMVSRAIPDKGWDEAIKAVKWANARSVRPVHLIVIGEGPEYDRLKPVKSAGNIHFLGFRSNIRDYFAAADVGFLPTRFRGESFPLVVIDCLLAGRPVIATNIGEIANMLSTSSGPAGCLFDLKNWQIPVATVGKLIAELAADKGECETLRRRVPEAAARFDNSAMVRKYAEVYRSCARSSFESLPPAPVASNASTASRGRSILIVTHDCFPHGAQQLLLQIAYELLSLGFAVRTLALGDGELFDRFAAAGPIIHTPSAGEDEVGNFLADAWADGVRDAITSTVVSGSAVPMLKDMGFAVLSLVHELPQVIRHMDQLDNAMAIARFADKVVFPARGVFESSEAFTSLPAERVVIRPQGLLRRNPYKGRKAEAHSIVCQKHSLSADTQIVLAVGYVQHRKGPDLFVDVAEQVLRSRPNTVFIWIGDGQPETEAQVKARIAELGLESRIRFIGLDLEPMAYYVAASAYALTSREDPFPNVVIESVAAGVPVVAFEGATCAGDYILAHGGLIATAGDIAHFSDLLKGCLAGAQNVPSTNSLGSFRQYVLDLLHALNGYPRVSVIVPNYNYGHLVAQRLENICRQSVPLYELVILDDASTDSSLAEIDTYVQRHCADAKVVVNSSNTGSVFQQWRRGATLCSGDLLWIAEVDDLAEPDFLARLVDAFEDTDVVLAYCQSRTMDDLGQSLGEDYLDYTRDISDRWEADYTREGIDEISDALAVKNTIPNVSAAVFRRSVLIEALDELGPQLQSFKVAGDWLVYLHVLKQGKIHFSSRISNWHCRHEKSVTRSTDAVRHYDEVATLQKLAQSLAVPSPETVGKADEYMVKLAKHLRLPLRPGAPWREITVAKTAIS